MYISAPQIKCTIYSHVHFQPVCREKQNSRMISKSCGLIVNGKHTDIVINVYQNREFIIVSQFKKFGSLVSVSEDYPLNEFKQKQYDSKVIFGKDEEEIHAAARYIAEQIESNKALLLSICLKDFEVSTLRTISKAIRKLRS